MKRWSSYILLWVFSIALSLPLLVHEHEAHHCEQEHDGSVVHNNTQDNHVCLMFNGNLANAFNINDSQQKTFFVQGKKIVNNYFEPYSSVLISRKQSRAPPIFG